MDEDAKYFFIFGVVVGVIVLIFSVCYNYSTGFEKEITIKKLTETAVSNGHVKLIQTTENEWYKVEDSFLRFKFRSRDTWGSLEEGKKYKVKGYGWRIGITSTYPNILFFERIE